MFTGIITATGVLTAREPIPSGARLSVLASWAQPAYVLGESIAVAGACMTVVDYDGQSFAFEVSPESLERTRLGRLTLGARLNLERAMRLSDRLGGHIVTGHVDGIATVERMVDGGGFRRVEVRLPDALLPLVVEKGSITLDGVSLTVNVVRPHGVELMLVPHTLQETTWSDVRLGDELHVEADVLARHVQRLLSFQR